MTNEAQIAIVDDNPQNLQYLGSLLEKEGYEPIIFNNGKHAIEFITKEQPDLVLLDIMMPDINGYEVCSKLKKQAETRDIPVIFLSGRIETDDIVRGFELGAADYIMKPFNTAILLARVNTHITLYRKTRQLQEMADNDALSGIANRRSFDKFLVSEWNRCRRYGLSISLLMIDIDHFKLYNDTYGHQKGDNVIQMIAQAISLSFTRSSDQVARYGGEEFTVISGDMDLEAMIEQGNKVIESIRDLKIPFESSPTAPFVTVSIGSSTAAPGKSDDNYMDLIKMSDRKLYEAKKERNCFAS